VYFALAVSYTTKSLAQQIYVLGCSYIILV